MLNRSGVTEFLNEVILLCEDPRWPLAEQFQWDCRADQAAADGDMSGN